MSERRHRVYLRDWYFNAGIVGFLRVVTDDVIELKDSNELKIGENYIEFSDQLLDGFVDKFIKTCFFELIDKKILMNRIDKELNELQGNLEKFKIKKSIDNLNKFPYKNLSTHLKILLNENMSINNYESQLNTYKKIIINTEEKLYETLMMTQERKAFIYQYLIPLRLKGITSISGLPEFINSIIKYEYDKKIHNHDFCVSCQSRKGSLELNNSISNIIGFNKDNTNWVWGYQINKIRICHICALIYNCSLLAFAYVTKKKENEFFNYFYTLNYNTKVKELYRKIKEFKHLFKKEKKEHGSLIMMLRETVRFIHEQKTKNIKENIHFIEISENAILGGQSTKGYDVFHFNLTQETAEFLFDYFAKDLIPSGYYKIKDSFIQIDEELIKLVISNQLSYINLNFFLNYWIHNEKKSFNIQEITEFIQKYIIANKGGNLEKTTLETIVKKAFANGKELREKLKKKDKENQINGLVYQLLNDLKIADREKFLDKYIRTSVSNQLSLQFAQEEMTDLDAFLQFGYSFINGLLYEKYQEKSDKKLEEK